ncbi:MAG TPA: oligopeptide:H+ symporter, partial [Kofleriaceae bacterium]|nr:oligopeptide:H+ symporter [Kofleriaceae bacterium]
RDSGYTIYYMGINIGAMIAPVVCGYFAQGETFQGFLRAHGINPGWCWHFGFAAASVGMILGVIQYSITQGWLGESGKHPTVPSDPRIAQRDRNVLGGIVAALLAVIGLFVYSSLHGLSISTETIGNLFGIGLAIFSIVLFVVLYGSARTTGERKRVIAMLTLFLGSIAFFGIFEQASTTLSLFAEDLTSRDLLGFTVPASYYQAINSIFIIVLAPLFAWLWLTLVRARKEPTSVMKFSIGMVLAALSFVVMLPTLQAVTHGDKASGVYLIALYFFSTCSELCISPVGLSSMSRLAPKRLAGMVMGTWFLGTANGNYLAGRAAGFTASRGYGFLFVFLIVSALVVAAALFVVSPMIRKMMAGDEPDPAAGVQVEPDPLPAARVVKSDTAS